MTQGGACRAGYPAGQGTDGSRLYTLAGRGALNSPLVCPTSRHAPFAQPARALS